MRGSKSDLPKTLEMDELEIREIEWGDIHLGIETYHKEFDIAPYFEGLPDNMCQCPHWGYVMKGSMVVHYRNHDELVNAGDAYYMSPGHIPTLEPGTELVEFSPKEEYQKTMEAVERNLAAMVPA